jgi:rhodanese-related sulfurtransferase
MLFLWLLLGGLTTAAAADEGFPGRAKFPRISTYSMTQLHDHLDQVVVVDARSHYEFETLRIKGALNIPVADKDFEDKVLQLHQQSKKPIVFYCNGRSCFKSYIAARRAKEANIQDVHAYDAGIFEWVKRYPEKSVLLNASPVDPKQLISRDRFKAHLLDPNTFSDRATLQGKATMILDVRDKYQRAGVGFYPGKERWVSLDQREKLQRYIQKARRSNKTLLIYDEVGKQVRWLQYALEKEGIKDYYFMHKGARGYFEVLTEIN